MYKIIEYTFLFFIIAFLQFFLFNNLALGVYVNPLIYLAFIVVLPINTSRFWTLIISAFVGVSMDLVMGTMGLSTISCLLTGLLRPILLPMIIGADDAQDPAPASVKKLGRENFLKYCSVLVTIHCLVYFSFEIANFTYYYLTLLRAVIASVLSIAFCCFTQYIFTLKR